MGNILEVKNLTKRFGGLTAVKDMSFEVQEGEILGLIGANGAGKTTMFNCVTGFLRFTEGTVRFLGEDVKGQKPDQLSQKGLTRTFQIVKPFMQMDVRSNVMVGAYCREKQAEKAGQVADEILETVGLYHRRNDMAKGLTISDRKRLELARTLATRPKLLLLDEVMGGLRPNEVDEMLILLERIKGRGITLMIIEHIMKAIMTISDRIVVMHHGEKIAEGKAQEIAKNPVVIDAYLGGSERLA